MLALTNHKQTAANKSTPPSMDPPPEVTPARELVDLDDFTCPAWNKLSWLTRALRTATCAVRGHDFESITWEEDDGGLDGIEHCKRCRKLF